MLITLMRSKLHRITITEANLNYIGSITLDPELMEAAGLFEGEKVQIVNINNGERLETYTITGERGSGEVCLNGPAARRVAVGDIIIVIAYAQMTPEEARTFKPTVVFPDTETNRILPV
jgi:aspartate 1-decarboxylase